MITEENRTEPLQCPEVLMLMLQILLRHRLAATRRDRAMSGKGHPPSEHRSLQKHSPLVQELRRRGVIGLEHTAAGEATQHLY